MNMFKKYFFKAKYTANIIEMQYWFDIFHDCVKNILPLF